MTWTGKLDRREGRTRSASRDWIEPLRCQDTPWETMRQTGKGAGGSREADEEREEARQGRQRINDQGWHRGYCDM